MAMKLPKDVARGKFVTTTSATYEHKKGPGSRMVLVGPKTGLLGDDTEVTIDNEGYAVFRVHAEGGAIYYVLADTPVEVIPDTKVSPETIRATKALRLAIYSHTFS